MNFSKLSTAELEAELQSWIEDTDAMKSVGFLSIVEQNTQIMNAIRAELEAR